MYAKKSKTRKPTKNWTTWKNLLAVRRLHCSRTLEDLVIADSRARALDRAVKALQNHVKVPWELNEMFGEFLPEEAEGADEDEVEAYEDSKKRLKVSWRHALRAL